MTIVLPTQAGAYLVLSNVIGNDIDEPIKAVINNVNFIFGCLCEIEKIHLRFVTLMTQKLC